MIFTLFNSRIRGLNSDGNGGKRLKMQLKVFSPFAISYGKWCTWSFLTVIKVNSNSEPYARSKLVFAKSAAILAQVCYIFHNQANTAQHHKTWK